MIFILPIAEIEEQPEYFELKRIEVFFEEEGFVFVDCETFANYKIVAKFKGCFWGTIMKPHTSSLTNIEKQPNQIKGYEIFSQ